MVSGRDLVLAGPRVALRTAQLATRVAVDVLYAQEGGRDVVHNAPDGWVVEAPWLWYFDGGGGEPPRYSNPIASGDGVYGATAVPAVSRCTNLIAGTLAGLPWEVLRDDPEGGVEKLPKPTWLDDPQASRLDGRVVSEAVDDVRLSAVEFWCQWITAALWYGDGYVLVMNRAPDGTPRPPLYQLHPLKVDIRDGRYYVQNADEPMPHGSIIHLRGDPPYEYGHGNGVLTRHAKTFGLSLTIDSYQGGQYRSGVPAGFLKSSQPNMQEEDAEALKQAWMKAHGSSRRSIAVLNATTDFQPIQFTPVDSALDSAKTTNLRDIATAFGIPPYMLGVPGDSSTYANVENRMIEFRMFTTLGWARRIESSVGSEFPRGTGVKIKTAGLERADTKTRYETYKLGIEGGWLTVEDVRELEDFALRSAADLNNEPTQPEGEVA